MTIRRRDAFPECFYILPRTKEIHINARLLDIKIILRNWKAPPSKSETSLNISCAHHTELAKAASKMKINHGALPPAVLSQQSALLNTIAKQPTSHVAGPNSIEAHRGSEMSRGHGGRISEHLLNASFQTDNALRSKSILLSLFVERITE